jgi:flagellar basal body-associated protein FliL
VAIKAFIIILLIGILVWILYSFNFSLPKISLQNEERPRRAEKPRAQRYENTEEEEKPEFGQPVSRSLIKSLLKQKIEEKVTQKEKKIRPMINFSGEKPTFNVSLLETNADQTVTIDETFLMEKAKALQNKLMEFNVPIMIE